MIKNWIGTQPPASTTTAVAAATPPATSPEKVATKKKSAIKAKGEMEKTRVFKPNT